MGVHSPEERKFVNRSMMYLNQQVAMYEYNAQVNRHFIQTFSP
jgi:hypothetical protein